MTLQIRNLRNLININSRRRQYTQFAKQRRAEKNQNFDIFFPEKEGAIEYFEKLKEIFIKKSGGLETELNYVKLNSPENYQQLIISELLKNRNKINTKEFYKEVKKIIKNPLKHNYHLACNNINYECNNFKKE